MRIMIHFPMKMISPSSRFSIVATYGVRKNPVSEEIKSSYLAS